MKTRYTALVLSLCTLAALSSCSKDEFPRPTYSLATTTKMGKKIVEGAAGYFGHIKSDSQKTLGPGVSLLDLSYLNMNGYAMQMYVYSVSLSSAAVTVTTPGNSTSPGSVQKLSEQVAALSVYTTVYGAVNGDSYIASSLQPTGIMFRDGAALKSTFSDATGGYFAILKDGSATIGAQDDYSTYRKSIQHAVGTKVQILKDGFFLPQSDTKAAARTAVAISQDGMTLWLIVVDGVYFYYSNGITYEDLSKIMLACGAYNGAVLESGDQTTLVVKDPLAETGYKVGNLPSNKGLEQNVVNGLAIISY